MGVAQKRGLLAGKTASQVRRFQKDWYGVTVGTGAKQCAAAVIHQGIGQEIAMADAQPGDFIVFNRTNKIGHSAILLGWMTDGTGRIVGIRYRSSQPSTNGVGDATEFFSDCGMGSIDRSTVYIARLNTVGWRRLFS